jgi:hypothetical protein
MAHPGVNRGSREIGLQIIPGAIKDRLQAAVIGPQSTAPRRHELW